MRWKLLRRRLSVSAPRMTVRSHMPWPLRWIAAALVLGFSAALAMWAFEFGKGIAGLDRSAKEELAQLRVEVERLRADNERLASVANTADSLLKAERAAQEKLGQTVRQLESEAQELKTSVAFFERLLPVKNEGLTVRGLRADVDQPGSIRFQMLVMQSGKDPVDFNGRYEVSATGVIGNRPWTSPSTEWATGDIKLRQYTRVEGALVHPPEVTLRSLQVRLLDAKQNVRATHTHKF
jgi:ABC-type transporter MlaC component